MRIAAGTHLRRMLGGAVLVAPVVIQNNLNERVFVALIMLVVWLPLIIWWTDRRLIAIGRGSLAADIAQRQAERDHELAYQQELEYQEV